MYSRILVPLDESKLAEQVLPYVTLFAGVFQSRIELIKVLEPLPPSTKGDPGRVLRSRFMASMRGQAQDYLEGVATTLREEGLTASAMAQRGSLASCIVNEAERETSTLIAMATRRRSGIPRRVLGSVTDKVLGSTNNPLLIIRPWEQEAPTLAVKLNTVIVPLDGSHLAEQVLPHVVALSKALALTVILVRVTPSHVFTLTSRRYENREQDAQAFEYAHDVKQNLYRQGVVGVEDMLLRGHPADGILDTARKTPDSLIALVTHHRPRVGRWMLGNVTEDIVRHSGNPVLVIRANSSKSETIRAST